MRTLLALLALSLALVACGDKGASASKVAFANTDITGLDYGKGFSLTDHTGTPRTLADFKGKVVLVFFGFTQCPDVCPTTLTKWPG